MKRTLLLTAAMLLLLAVPAFASTAGPSMPWDGPLQTVSDSVKGPFLHYIMIILIVISGIIWAATEHAQGVRKFSQVIFGGAIAFEAASLFASLGLNGALV